MTILEKTIMVFSRIVDVDFCNLRNNPTIQTVIIQTIVMKFIDFVKSYTHAI